MAPEQWVQVLARKKEALSKAKIVMPDETKDFETFQLFLSRLCIDFASRGVAKFVSQMLAPSFDHIRSFAQAINAATQSINYAPFIWAGLQVVLEVGPTINVSTGLRHILILMPVRMPIR